MACLIVHLLGGLHAFLEEVIFQFIWQSKKINFAFDTSLNIHELASEEMTFQEYSKVTSFQTVSVSSYFLLKVPVGPRPSIFVTETTGPFSSL